MKFSVFSDTSDDDVFSTKSGSEDNDSNANIYSRKPSQSDRRDMRQEYLEYKNKGRSKSKRRSIGPSVGPSKTPRSDSSRAEPSRDKSKVTETKKHFELALRKTSARGDRDAFKYVLKKTPVPVVLHYMHLLFYLNRQNDDNVRILTTYNDKFNIVSRYFIKAMQSESRAERAMSSVKTASKELLKRTPVKDVSDINHFTPEFILMKMIEAGNIVSFDQVLSEWEVHDGFKSSCDLVAAFFGIRKFFSDPTRFKLRQNLVISCICGGSVETLVKIVGSDTMYLSDFTMRKTREMCTPSRKMLEYLRVTYGLTF